MSVICSALQWVLDRRRQEESVEAGQECGKNQGNHGGLGSDDEPDWMREFVVNKEREGQPERINKNKKHGSLLGKPGKKNREISKDFQVVDEDSPPEMGFENSHKKIDELDVDVIDKEFLLEEYESEDEEALGKVTSKRKATRSVLTSSSEEDESDDEEEEEAEEKRLKIFFCSRTHSQLSQFIKELRKTVFANEMDVVSLGSRKNLCINEGLQFTYFASRFTFLVIRFVFFFFLDFIFLKAGVVNRDVWFFNNAFATCYSEVLKLGNSTRINERCLELQKKKKKEPTKIKVRGF